MRDAALMVATLRDDYAPSLARRIGTGLARLWTALVRHRSARRHLAWVRGLDAHMLDDLGLRPEDLVGLDAGITAQEATRRLRAIAEQRRSAWTRVQGWREG